MAYKVFKGTVSEYRVLHYWVEKQLGKPIGCENCSTTEIRHYEWANISGEYLRDISDWARLCKRCHCLIDNVRASHLQNRQLQEVCKRGHRQEGENIFYRIDRRTGGNIRSCKVCNVELTRERMRRIRAEAKVK